MKTAKDVLKYLEVTGLELHNLIGENDSEFNKGRLYVMNKVISSVRELIELEERPKPKQEDGTWRGFND